MTKQEAIEKIKSVSCDTGVCSKFMEVSLDKVIEIVEQIDEPEKPVVPQVAVDYYEAYKNLLIGFDEWFCDFYTDDFSTDFKDGEKLAKWLYDNDKKTNRKHELALATLIVNGLDAVQIEQPQLYTVNIPNVYHGDFGYSKTFDNYSFYNRSDATEIRFELTESEIKKHFEWAWKFAKPVEVE